MKPHSTIDFEALRYLLASAETGKFTRAAELLGIETGSLSRRIQRVEDELGLTVFERGHDGLRLTAAGGMVIQHARRALAEFGGLVSAGHSGGLGQLGKIRLGMRLPSVGHQFRVYLVFGTNDFLMCVSQSSR